MLFVNFCVRMQFFIFLKFPFFILHSLWCRAFHLSTVTFHLVLLQMRVHVIDDHFVMEGQEVSLTGDDNQTQK